MKACIKILWIITKIAELAVYGLFALSMFTIMSTFAGDLLQEPGETPFKVESSPSEGVTFIMKFKNNGFMDTEIKVKVEVAFEDDVIEGGDSVNLKPGEEGEIRISLKPTPMQVAKMATQKSKGYISLEGRTLSGRAVIGVKAEVGGGL